MFLYIWRDKGVIFPMKCQFCNKNEADKVFYLNYMGGLYQISVCDDCLQRMWQQAVASGQAETFRNYSGWWPGRPEPRRYGERAFPDDAAEDLKKRRRLSLQTSYKSRRVPRTKESPKETWTENRPRISVSGPGIVAKPKKLWLFWHNYFSKSTGVPKFRHPSVINLLTV